MLFVCNRTVSMTALYQLKMKYDKHVSIPASPQSTKTWRHTQKFAKWDTGSQSSIYVVYATACVYRELYGKIADLI